MAVASLRAHRPDEVGEAMILLFAPPSTVTDPKWMAVELNYRVP